MSSLRQIGRADRGFVPWRLRPRPAWSDHSGKVPVPAYAAVAAQGVGGSRLRRCGSGRSSGSAPLRSGVWPRSWPASPVVQLHRQARPEPLARRGNPRRGDPNGGQSFRPVPTCAPHRYGCGLVHVPPTSKPWPPRPRGRNHRCSDISEYRVPVAGAAQPGTVSFDVLIRPDRGLAKLGYKVRYRWTDRPAEILTGMVRP